MGQSLKLPMTAPEMLGALPSHGVLHLTSQSLATTTCKTTLSFQDECRRHCSTLNGSPKGILELPELGARAARAPSTIEARRHVLTRPRMPSSTIGLNLHRRCIDDTPALPEATAPAAGTAHRWRVSTASCIPQTRICGHKVACKTA